MCNLGKKRRRKRKKGRRPASETEDTFPSDGWMEEQEAADTFDVASFGPGPPPDIDQVIEPKDVLNSAANRPMQADSVTYGSEPCPPMQKPDPTCEPKPEPPCNDVASKEEECCDPPEEEACARPSPPPDHAYAAGYGAAAAGRGSKARTADAYRPDPIDFPANKTVVPMKITVQVHQNGRPQPLAVTTNTTDTVFELRFLIFESTRILPSNQILMFKGRDLPLEKQLGECGICDRSMLELTDHGEAITEYIIEITDAMKVRELKQALRKLEIELREAKKRSADKLRQNDWEGTDRLVQEAQVLERKKQKKQQELEAIHEKHKQGFRQLHVKIMRLFSEKRKSSAEYARLKRELLAAVQRNEVLRSTEIVNDLMVQFIRHDGCERELMLLEAFVPDMVEASAEERRDDDLSDVDPPVDPRKSAQQPAQRNSGPPQPRGYAAQPAPPQQREPYRQDPYRQDPYPRGYQPEQYPAQAPAKQPQWDPRYAPQQYEQVPGPQYTRGDNGAFYF